ncbi:unnamed protein product [Closterium sp. NIES-54]
MAQLSERSHSFLELYPSSADPTLFIRRHSEPFYILVHVDDFILVAKDLAQMTSVQAALSKALLMKDLGDFKHYLGMEITRDRQARTISLSQEFYINNVLKRFEMELCTPMDTPLPLQHLLTAPAVPTSEACTEPYPELVGSLMYAMMCTRPDLAYPVSVLSRYVALGRFTDLHWSAAKQVLRYLKGTKSHVLTLGGLSPPRLEDYTDSSWADDQTDRRSSQGYCFTLGSGIVRWRSTRSSAVSLSSCEAELYAGTMAAQEARWLTFLLQELGYPQSTPTLCTSRVALAFQRAATNEVHTARTASDSRTNQSPSQAIHLFLPRTSRSPANHPPANISPLFPHPSNTPLPTLPCQHSPANTPLPTLPCQHVRTPHPRSNSPALPPVSPHCRRSSVNRPPTPEPEGRVGGGGEPTSLRQVVDAKLLESGEKERLKTLLRDRLEECGWADDLLVYARAYVSKVGRENVSLEELIRAITPKGRGAWKGGGVCASFLFTRRAHCGGQGVTLTRFLSGFVSDFSGGTYLMQPSTPHTRCSLNAALHVCWIACAAMCFHVLTSASVPGPVKAELLQRIQSFLTTK